MANAIIVYDTAYGYTEQMAQAIEKGMKDDGIDVVVKKALDTTVDELSGFDAVVLGCPTYYNDLISSVKWFLVEMRKADLKGKVGGAFGAYGWSGESIDLMRVPMKQIFGMDTVDPGLKVKMTEIVSGEGKKASVEYGKKIAERIKQKQAGQQ